MERLCLSDLMQATNGELAGAASNEMSVERVCIDSRDVRPGDVFWALRGERHDGHDFIPQAVSNGAALCVTNAERGAIECSAPEHGPKLIVHDTRSALMDLAGWYRRTVDALVIGVTGSVGKTTTRELIHAALSSEFSGIRSQKNFNNTIGLPLTLLDIEHHHEFAVVEMGASREGDIAELSEIASPEVGVITAIGLAHLESFGCLDSIIQAKGELLESLPSTGFAVLPGDDPIMRLMADRAPCPVIFVGEEGDCQLRATRVRSSWEGLQFEADGHEYHIPIYGRHHLTNALCAIAIGREIGLRPASLADGLAEFHQVDGRGQLLSIGDWTVIDDTYNASPRSMAAACQMLSDLELPGVGRRILVVGDMRELGVASGVEHECLGETAAKLRIDLVLACGEYADHVAHGAEQFGIAPHRIASAPNVETLEAVLDCWLEPGDVILVKGSRATRMERIIEWLRERAEWEKRLQTQVPRRHCA